MLEEEGFLGLLTVDGKNQVRHLRFVLVLQSYRWWRLGLREWNLIRREDQGLVVDRRSQVGCSCRSGGDDDGHSLKSDGDRCSAFDLLRRWQLHRCRQCPGVFDAAALHLVVKAGVVVPSTEDEVEVDDDGGVVDDDEDLVLAVAVVDDEQEKFHASMRKCRVEHKGPCSLG